MSDYTSTQRLGPDGILYTVVLKDGLQPHQTSGGLYHVTHFEREHRIEVRRADAVETRNAAVNGILNDLDRAAVVMLDKVNATSDLRRDRPPVEYTLYHVPTRGATNDISRAGGELVGLTTEDAKALSRVLENTSKAGKSVVWSVHSRGATVFDSAVSAASSRGVHLEGQSVAVYNGAANVPTMKYHLRKADVALIGRGFYNHSYDPVPQLIGQNTENPIKVAGALFNARAVAFADQSLHTWHMRLTERDYRDVPTSQWEQAGVDLRPTAKALGNAAQPRDKGAPAVPDSKAADASARNPALLRAAGVNAADPLYPALLRTIGAADEYASCPPEKREALLNRFSAELKHDVSEPALTGVPFRQEALNFVKGQSSTHDLVGAAQKHTAAARLHQTLHRDFTISNLGLSR